MALPRLRPGHIRLPDPNGMNLKSCPRVMSGLHPHPSRQPVRVLSHDGYELGSTWSRGVAKPQPDRN